ncbi:MAG: hypothetical protein WA140_00965 [Geobacteraceae bacterium]
MQVSCEKCSFATEIDATLLPSAGMQGICPRCGVIIPLGGWIAPEPPFRDVVPQVASPAASTSAEIHYPIEDEGRVNIINIIALLFVIDSTLSLIGRVPGLSGIFGSGPELTFHQRAKYLYDTLMAAGFFVSAFGLLARKNWARIASVWLLGLGLAEGLYILAYQYYAISELEKNLKEGFPEMKSNQNAKMVGCLLYAFFIVKLNSRTTKARFKLKAKAKRE